MVTSMLTILLVRQPRRLPKWMLPVLDAVGLAVFVGIGVNKAFLAETGPLVAVCMGVIYRRSAAGLFAMFWHARSP